MTTLKDVWKQLGVDSVNENNFKILLQKLSIKLDDTESHEVFTMIDFEKNGKLTYDEVRTFLKMTQVYDRCKYPKPVIKRRSSYKIYPK